MDNKKLFSTAEVARILGISRVAVFKKIKSGEIKAKKIGRNYVIGSDEMDVVLGAVIPEKRKEEIESTITKAVKQYGEAFKMLGKE